MLVQRGALRSPPLYLSLYLRAHRAEYSERLTGVRERGDWEGWIHFFLRGVASTAKEAMDTAERIFDLRESHRSRVIEHQLGQNALRLTSLLFARPVVNVNLVQVELGVAWATANKLIGQLEELGLVREVTGQKRSRVFRCDPYLALFDDPADGVDETQAELTGPAR